MDIELHDWEVLDDSNSAHTSAYLNLIEQNSDSIIRSDHFSLDSHKNSVIEDVTDHVSDRISVDSDNPSWIDPVFDVYDSNCKITKPIGEISSTEGSDDVEVESRRVDFDESVFDSGEIESKSSGCEEICEEIGEELEVKSVEIVKSDGEGNRVAVWWKLPFDLLKYCLFKASPVWTLSAAAAMMGVVILSRRLYRMRQKTRTLQLRVAVDDKKVSQVMSRAARLNEAFSVVKRTPIIRPSLPATGITPWPMMALR